MNFLKIWILPLVMVACASPAQARQKPTPRPPHSPKVLRVTDPQAIRDVESDLKATTDRARRDLQTQLRRVVVESLGDEGVPASWAPPDKLLMGMVVGPVAVEPIRYHDLDLFKASCRVDFSPYRKHDLVQAYGRQVAGRRMATFGGALGFTLVCLAGIAGYIRLDEATRGYYTNRLRLAAAAGVGAAGVVVYQILT